MQQVKQVGHTPGPWTVDPYNDIHDSAGELLASAYALEVDGKLQYTPVTYANATLIAAAPEMAEALRECADYVAKYGMFSADESEWNGEKHEGRIVVRARAALAKAGLL